MTALKPYTLYRCPCGQASRWTGALLSPADDRCPALCGRTMVEVVDDGHRYRLEWETDAGYGWHPTVRESGDRAEIVDQFRVLRRWAETGDEPVRNVRLSRAETVWTPCDPEVFA